MAMEHSGGRGRQQPDRGGFVPSRRANGLPEDSVKYQQSLLRKQLQHFDDPYQMAKHVESELYHGRYEQALEFTRKASATANCVVSWNFIIRQTLKDQRLRTALKLGLARSDHAALAVAEAVKLYQGLLASERVQSNEIHLNAVVNVCARARDLDALFSVIDSADGHGISPSRITYAIILHALRADIEADEAATRPKFMTPQQRQENRDKALQRSKIIWDEVIRRWRSGKLLIDEELVCAMDRILLLGHASDAEAILELIEQTMRIPNILAEAAQSKEGGGDVVDSKTPLAVAGTTTNAVVSVPPKIQPRKGAGSGIYVRPGHNTLSLVMRVLTIKKFTGVALKYWAMLTTHYNIVPDSNNWHWLMTCMKRAHSSARAAEVICELMPRQLLNYTTFRMAMATCWKDIRNPGVYANADSIMATMLTVLDTPDPEATRDYLTIVTSRINLAQGLTTRHGVGKGNGDGAAADAASPPTVQDQKALEKAKEHYVAARASIDSVSKPVCAALDGLEYSGVDHNALKAISGTAYNETAELVAIARRLVSMYDRLAEAVCFPADDMQQLKAARQDLIRHITSFYVPTDVNEEAGDEKGGARKKRQQQQHSGTAKHGRGRGRSAERPPRREKDWQSADGDRGEHRSREGTWGSA